MEAAKFEKHKGETQKWGWPARVRHGSGTMTYLFSFMFEFLTFLFINLGFIVPLKLKTRTFVVPGGPRHGSGSPSLFVSSVLSVVLVCPGGSACFLAGSPPCGAGTGPFGSGTGPGSQVRPLPV